MSELPDLAVLSEAALGTFLDELVAASERVARNDPLLEGKIDIGRASSRSGAALASAIVRSPPHAASGRREPGSARAGPAALEPPDD